jgi:putative transposase
MPNHWHLVVWPQGDELPRFMHWLTATHTRRWHLARQSRGTGHVYQDRYHAVPVQTELHLLNVLRYVERNPLRAQLVDRAEQWQWGSLWRRCNSCNDLPLAAWPIPQPENWITLVNEPQTMADLAAIQAAIRQGEPIGNKDWREVMAPRFGLRLRQTGRPRK